MIGLLLPTLFAALASVLLGGTLRGCLRVRVAWWPVLIGCFGLELVLYSPPVNQQDWALVAGPWLWVASKLVMLAVLARNAQANPSTRLSWLVIVTGVGLNTLAVVANGGHMPQSVEAAAAVWGAEYVRPDTYSRQLENVAWMGPSASLWWLCDILPQPRWLPRANVVSVGDVALALGVASWVFAITREHRRRTPRGTWANRILASTRVS